MRIHSVAVLAIVLVCVAMAAGAQEIGSGSAPVISSVTTFPGAMRIDVENTGGITAARPSMRFLVLPPGATEVRIEPVEEGASSSVEAVVGETMVLRGLRVAPVVFSRRPDGMGVSPESSEKAAFEVRYHSGAFPRAPSLGAHDGRGFYDTYQDLLLSSGGDMSDRLDLTGGSEGGFLILTVPEFVTDIEPLVAWRREMGYDVSVITTAEAGTRNDELREYIRDIYQNAPVPPQYLLLVGDVEQIPGFDYHQSVSDLPYSLLDGDDFLPDLEVGRLSAQTSYDLANIVDKLLRYEQDPYRDEGDEWFSRGLVVAGNSGSRTPVPVCRWCRDQLMDPNVGYTAVDTVYYPPHWSTGKILIKRSIDLGVSIVCYRGWAYGWQGWEPPKFTVAEIPTLANEGQTPVVLSFVCDNGDYAEDECFGEAWIRARTDSSRGAVAFIGNSEHWSHTRFNDAAAMGAFNAIRQQGARRLGQILNASKAEIFREFPDQLYYDPFADESVEFYYYIYGLLGDPSMEFWTASPRDLVVDHPDTMADGSSLFEVAVYEADAVTPVDGARVGLCQGEDLLGCAWTDASGGARIVADFDETGGPVRVTVTGTGLAAYRDSIVVSASDPFLARAEVLVDDDNDGDSMGNGDGIVNPGEILELTVRLENRGSSPIAGISGTLQSQSGIVVGVGDATYPAIAPGGTEGSYDPFVVYIDDYRENGFVAPFRMEAVTLADTFPSGFDLTVVSSDLRYDSHVIGGDGIADPGEISEITLTLLNDGAIETGGAQGILRSESPAVARVIDSVAYFSSMTPGFTGSHAIPYSFEVTDTTAIGQAAVFTLSLLTAKGAESETGFSVIVGDVDHRAPLGPDDHGYYAYDNSDTDYPDAVPEFEWIDCSPAYGGMGVPLAGALEDNEQVIVELPFTFTFYGVDYDTLLVSDNGWVSFETTTYFDFYNWTMPSTYGNGAQLAVFWDNLDPEKEYEGEPVGDGIYTWYDSARNRFIVEWSRLGNYRSQHEGEGRPDYDDLQTFQLILFDPDHYPTPTNDGVIRYQYKQIVNNDTERMFATVGIENETEDDGLEYTYTNMYPAAAAPLSAGLAIQFSTAPPRYDPFRLAYFDASPSEDGVRLAWEPGDDRPRTGYRIYRGVAGSGSYDLVPGGCLGASARTFLDVTADPDVFYLYKVGSLDPVGYEAVLGPFTYAGEERRPLSFALENRGLNPSRGPVLLQYSLPEESEVRVDIYSVRGRLVRTLVKDRVDPGVWETRWDGRNERGEQVPSGVYFGRLVAGEKRRGVKIALVR